MNGKIEKKEKSKTTCLLMLTALLGCLSLPAMGEETKGLALMAEMGTTGPGMDLVGKINPSFNWRAGFNAFSGETDSEIRDLPYEMEVDYGLTNLLLDFFPTEKQFRLTAGLAYYSFEAELDGDLKVGKAYKVGHHKYAATDIGVMDGKIESDSLAPYAGVGWGNPFSANSSWSFQCDVGMMLIKKPEVTLTSSNPNHREDLTQDLAEERSKIRNDMPKLYPVISAGFSVRF